MERSDSAAHRPFEEVVDELPAALVPAHSRGPLKQLYRELDGLGWRSDAGEVYIDEKRLHKLIRQHAPRAFADEYLRRAKAEPGSRVRDPNGARIARLRWSALASHLPDGRAPGEALRELGLDASSSLEDLRRAIRISQPDFPEEFIAPEQSQQAAARVVDALAAGVEATTAAESAWDRLWRCLAVEGALILFGVVAIMLIVLLSGGTFVAAVAALAPLVRYWIPFVVLMCVYRAVHPA
jgi:hypothetical protein